MPYFFEGQKTNKPLKGCILELYINSKIKKFIDADYLNILKIHLFKNK